MLGDVHLLIFYVTSATYGCIILTLNCSIQFVLYCFHDVSDVRYDLLILIVLTICLQLSSALLN